jgi:hypothetical protein
MKNISRRGFISASASVVGAGISLQMLTSCGDSSTAGQDSSTDSLVAPGSDQVVDEVTDQITNLPSDLQLVQRFPQVLVPGNLRLPISLALSSGIISASSDFKFPQTLSAKVIDLSTDKVIIENTSATLYGAEISLPYYPFQVTIESPGNYSLIVSGGPPEGTAFSVLERALVLVPGVGDLLPGFDTPTFGDHRQVEPICTRQPEPCPFHKLTLNEALQLGVPVAYLVGTPAHCSTGTCAPALSGLIDVASRIVGSAVFIHAEIYADEAATVIAPAVQALSLSFEPVLFITDKNGKIVKRLDAVFDASEFSEALASVGVS